MFRRAKNSWALVGALMWTVLLVGCEKEAPAEPARKNIDEMVEEARDRIAIMLKGPRA